VLLLKRMHQRAVVFAALLAVTAIVSGLSVGIVGFLGIAEVEGVRSQLEQRTGSDRALELSLSTDDDAAAQDERVDALLATVFRDGGRELGLDVTRSVVSANPVALSNGVKAFVASIPDLESKAELVDGAWPTTPAEVSVQADAAAALELAPGDEIGVGDAVVTIAGTWRVIDPLDPRWVGSPLILGGTENSVEGPLVFDEPALATVGALTRSQWAIVPDIPSLQAGDLERLTSGWDSLIDTMRADGGFDVNGLDRGGRFPIAAASTQQTVDALAAVGPVALIVIAAIGLLTLVELGRLLVILRAEELLLLWSRGDTVRALTAVATIEAIVVAALGSLAGMSVGVLVLAQDPALLGPVAWAAPLLVIAAAALTFGATALMALRSIARREPGEANGRVARVTGIAGPVLLTLAAALSTWQLLLYGSPLIPARDGSLQLDPVAVVAPALLLLAVVTVAVAAMPLLARLLDRRADRAVGPALVLRMLARRTRMLAAPAVLCALACGQLTIAAGYAQTWDTAYTTASALRQGSDLTATGGRGLLTEDALASISSVAGVSAVAPVFTEPTVVGGSAASMVAITPAALADLATEAGGIVEPVAAAALIRTPLPGPVLPAGTREIQVLTSGGADSGVELTVVIADEYGVRHDLPTTDDYRADVPAGHGEWKLLAFVLDLPDGGLEALSVTGLTADDDDIELGDGWAAVGFNPLIQSVTADPTGVGYLDGVGLTSVRLSPLLGENADTISPQVVISSALAEDAGLRVGDIVPLTLEPRLPTFACVVVGVVPAIPGAPRESAVLVDGGVIQAVRARVYSATATPQVAWIGAADAAGASSAVREAVPAAVVRSLRADPDRSILASAGTALWIGAAGAGILALVALVAVVGAQLRARRDEMLTLRALGVSDRELAGSRQAELGVVLAAGAIVGLAAGALATVLTIPALARAAVPEAYASLATVVGVQPLGLAVGLVALLLAFGAVLVVYGRGVTR